MDELPEILKQVLRKYPQAVVKAELAKLCDKCGDANKALAKKWDEDNRAFHRCRNGVIFAVRRYREAISAHGEWSFGGVPRYEVWLRYKGEIVAHESGCGQSHLEALFTEAKDWHKARTLARRTPKSWPAASKPRRK